MHDTGRVHPELVWHLDLIVHVAFGLIGADQGYERLWGSLWFLKELMRCGDPTDKIDESVIQPHELRPVSIAWPGCRSRNLEFRDLSILIFVVESQHIVGRFEYLIDMEFRDRLIQPCSLKDLINSRFRIINVK